MRNLLHNKKRLSIILVICLVLNIFLGYISANANQVTKTVSSDSDEEISESVGSVTNTDEFKLADKKAEYVETDSDEQRYRISLTVPGYEEDPIKNEVVVILDASDSQGSNWSSVKESILSIGNSVLNETSKTFDNNLTIIGFGISDKIVAKNIHSYSELESLLEKLPTNNAFLYGRSATNCEAGINSAKSYLETLDDITGSYVIFVSDSASNMDEELVAWETWTENKSWHWGSKTTEYLAKMLLLDYEFYRILDGGEPIPVTTNVFGWSFDGFVDEYITLEYLESKIDEIESKISEIEEELYPASPSNAIYYIASPSEIKVISDTDDLESELEDLYESLEFINSIYEDIDFDGYNGVYSDERTNYFINELLNNIGLYSKLKSLSEEEKDGTPYWRIWVDELWKDVYEEYGLTWGEGVEYPVSYIEHAFVDYDEAHDSNISDSFYTAIVKYVFEDVHSKPKTKGIRAAKAIDTLAEMDSVRKIYMIGYGSSANDSWMNSDRATKYETGNYITTEKASYYHVSAMTNLGTALEEICPDIITTMYDDVQVTDNMSKWVTLDFNSIGVYKDDVLICRYIYDPETGEGENVWVIPEEERPTSKEAVQVSIVKVDSYEEAGPDVIGNINGDIYKIIWNVKDGTLYATDNYSLKYEVYIDEDEPGYDSSLTYPTNGKTTVEYTSLVDGEPYVEEVEVPVAEKPTEAPTEPSTEESTEGSTESSTEGSTESSTEESTESSTEESIESSTEESTESSTEESKEYSTEDIESDYHNRYYGTSDVEHGPGIKESESVTLDLDDVDSDLGDSTIEESNENDNKNDSEDKGKLKVLPRTGINVISYILWIFTFIVSFMLLIIHVKEFIKNEKENK